MQSSFVLQTRTRAPAEQFLTVPNASRPQQKLEHLVCPGNSSFLATHISLELNQFWKTRKN